jgi:WD40 repeat protein
MLGGYSLSVYSIAFSPDSKQVVSGSHNKIVQLWDTVISAALQTLEGHYFSVRSVAFSPDSKQVVSRSLAFEAFVEVLKESKSKATDNALRLLEILSMLDSAVLPLQIFQST